MGRYPEHEKMASIREDLADPIAVIGEFLDWVRDESGLVLAEWDGEVLRHAGAKARPKTLIGRFFGINPYRLELEKEEMFADLRHGGLSAGGGQ